MLSPTFDSIGITPGRDMRYEFRLLGVGVLPLFLLGQLQLGHVLVTDDNNLAPLQ